MDTTGEGSHRSVRVSENDAKGLAIRMRYGVAKDVLRLDHEHERISGRVPGYISPGTVCAIEEVALVLEAHTAQEAQETARVEWGSTIEDNKCHAKGVARKTEYRAAREMCFGGDPSIQRWMSSIVEELVRVFYGDSDDSLRREYGWYLPRTAEQFRAKIRERTDRKQGPYRYELWVDAEYAEYSAMKVRHAGLQ